VKTDYTSEPCADVYICSLNSGAARMLPGVGEVGPQAAGPSSGEGNLKKEPQKNVCIFGLNSYRILRLALFSPFSNTHTCLLFLLFLKKLLYLYLFVQY
jgi:hypothetical protein